MSKLTLALCASLLAWAAPALSQQPSKPLAQGELDDGVVAEVTESSRKDGVLTVRVRFRNTGGKPAKVSLVGEGGYIHTYISADNTKYQLIRDSGGQEVATPRDGGGWLVPTIKPGGTFGWWGKFPAPPAPRKSYTLYFKVGPPIEDVPIVDK